MFDRLFKFFTGLLAKDAGPQDTPARAVIYADRSYRGSMVDEAIRKRKPDEFLKIGQLRPWEVAKNMNNPAVAEFVIKRLLPELKRKGVLPPLVVWRRSGKNYVVDGHHRLAAYREYGYESDIPVIVLRSEDVVLTEWTPQCGSPHP